MGVCFKIRLIFFSPGCFQSQTKTFQRQTESFQTDFKRYSKIKSNAISGKESGEVGGGEGGLGLYTLAGIKLQRNLAEIQQHTKMWPLVFGDRERDQKPRKAKQHCDRHPLAQYACSRTSMYRYRYLCIRYT